MLKSAEIVESPLSARVVAYLRQHGRTLKEIGRLTGTTESFISRVARQERYFTLDHLCRLERSLNQPLPFLLLQSTSKASLPKPLRPLYKEALRLLESSGKLRAALLENRGKASSPSGPRSRRVAG